MGDDDWSGNVPLTFPEVDWKALEEKLKQACPTPPPIPAPGDPSTALPDTAPWTKPTDWQWVPESGHAVAMSPLSVGEELYTASESMGPPTGDAQNPCNEIPLAAYPPPKSIFGSEKLYKDEYWGYVKPPHPTYPLFTGDGLLASKSPYIPPHSPAKKPPPVAPDPVVEERNASPVEVTVVFHCRHDNIEAVKNSVWEWYEDHGQPLLKPTFHLRPVDPASLKPHDVAHLKKKW